MTQKTVGYVELEWTCKRCGTRNLGTQKTCQGCGAPMEQHERFEMPAEQKLITDAEKLAQAQKGPDIHCGYCGARNPAGAEFCSQCGGNLKEGQARQAGQVVGAFQAGAIADVSCPFCGEKNPATAAKCAKCGGALKKTAPEPAAPSTAKKPLPWAIIGIGAALLCGLVILLVILSNRTTDLTGFVQTVQWERSIPIMALAPVEHEAWQDEVPAQSTPGACTRRVRSTESEPVAGADVVEVCGTPYSVDQGSGVAKVVQDCEYEVYDQWCTYAVNELRVVDNAVAQGADLNPQWPAVALQSGQQEGTERSEKYLVVFSANDGQESYRYAAGSAEEYARFTAGSEWILKVNSFGNVTEVAPAK